MLPDVADTFKVLLNTGRFSYTLPPGGIPIEEFCHFIRKLDEAAKILGLRLIWVVPQFDGEFAVECRRATWQDVLGNKPDDSAY